MEYVFSMLLGTLLLPYIFTSHLTFKKIKCLCFESISLCVALDHSVEVFLIIIIFYFPKDFCRSNLLNSRNFAAMQISVQAHNSLCRLRHSKELSWAHSLDVSVCENSRAEGNNLIWSIGRVLTGCQCYSRQSKCPNYW